MTPRTAAGIYVHFPWCVKKCPYCDFNSHPVRPETDHDRYVNALAADWATQKAWFKPDAPWVSAFFGGGTPSLLCAQHINRIVDLFANDLALGAEVTMEANPGTTEHAAWDTYRLAGVNRLSIGAQSFSETALLKLGRIHGPSEIVQAFQDARDGGFDNINLDLMHGLPGQTVADALADLDQAIALEPEHISWYQLTLEAKTEFGRRPPMLPVEPVLAEIEAKGMERLATAGYERYEVSAYARPGRRSIHNENYWTFGDYLGFGAGAHGKWTPAHGSIKRTRKPASPRIYQDDPTVMDIDPIADDELVGEFLMNALRLIDGVPIETLEERSGVPFEHIAQTWERCVNDGLVRSDRLATTAFGLRHLDSVVSRFI